jgi:hypothetical protein
MPPALYRDPTGDLPTLNVITGPQKEKKVQTLQKFPEMWAFALICRACWHKTDKYI